MCGFLGIQGDKLNAPWMNGDPDMGCDCIDRSLSPVSDRIRRKRNNVMKANTL